MKTFYASLATAAILFLFGMSIDSYLDSQSVELLFFDDNLLSNGLGNNIGVVFASSIIAFVSLSHGLITKWKTLTKKSKRGAILIIFIALVLFVITSINLFNFYFS